MKTATAIALATLLLAGCASQDASQDPTAEVTPLTKQQRAEAPYSEERGALLADAAAVAAGEETIEDTDPAIVACGSVAEFTVAAEDDPGALDGADPVTVADRPVRAGGGTGRAGVRHLPGARRLGRGSCGARVWTGSDRSG